MKLHFVNFVLNFTKGTSIVITATNYTQTVLTMLSQMVKSGLSVLSVQSGIILSVNLSAWERMIWI
jgi:sulfur transfer complex TusBCD TusB component (DsrH family)